MNHDERNRITRAQTDVRIAGGIQVPSPRRSWKATWLDPIMPDTFAPISIKTQRTYGVDLGTALPWRDYSANAATLDKYLDAGDRLFLLAARQTQRGERLWLIGVYENIHHVTPLHASGRRTTSIKDLVTLCPTCHSVAHALATATSSERVDLKLLSTIRNDMPP